MKDVNKILIFSDCNSPGGVWVYSLRTASMFKDDRDIHCTLLTHPPRSEEEQQRIDLASCMFNKIAYIRRPKSDFQTDVELAREFAALINKLDVDVYFPNYRNYTYVALHWLNKRIMSIGVCHNNHASYYDVLLRYITLLDGIICPNSEAANFLDGKLKRLNTPIEYIPHYIEPLVSDKYLSNPPPISNDCIKLIYFGRIEKEQKEVFELIAIVQALKDQNQRVALTVIGEGSEKVNFATKVKTQCLEGEVTLYDAMDRDALIPYILDADFSVICSTYEGFCYSAAESMLLGVPVASYENSAMCDYISNMDNGIVVTWGDAGTLAEKLIAVYSDQARYNLMRDSAIKTIETNFSVDNVRSQYKRLFDQTSKTSKQKYWPRFRPTLEPMGKQLLGRIIERLGKVMGFWF